MCGLVRRPSSPKHGFCPKGTAASSPIHVLESIDPLHPSGPVVRTLEHRVSSMDRRSMGKGGGSSLWAGNRFGSGNRRTPDQKVRAQKPADGSREDLRGVTRGWMGPPFLSSSHPDRSGNGEFSWGTIRQPPPSFRCLRRGGRVPLSVPFDSTVGLYGISWFSCLSERESRAGPDPPAISPAAP